MGTGCERAFVISCVSPPRSLFQLPLKNGMCSGGQQVGRYKGPLSEPVPTCGHGLRQGAFVPPHLLPSGAHSILKWQLKEGPWRADTGYYKCPLAPCPHSNPSFLDRCGSRPFLQVVNRTCFSLDCPQQTKRSAPMLTLHSRRKENPLGRSQVSRSE